MSDAPSSRAPSPGKVLRKLFLTLFLRGRSARGLKREATPKSITSKLLIVLLVYLGVGTMLGLGLRRMPLFVGSLYLHCMTLAFLGMFVAASAGEVLFNKEEADILMHRPVAPTTMLWAKISVLVQVSLLLAGAFNLPAMVLGLFRANSDVMFLLAHAISSASQALFATASIVITYQLCLRWFGRERMESLMTSTQVLVTIGAILMSQAGPQIFMRMQFKGDFQAPWWINLLPPAWFAGFDDALAGTHQSISWILAGAAMGATVLALWLAFGKLARDYEVGLQAMNEARTTKPSRQGRRLLDKLVHLPPLSWWLRDSVVRASFLLTAAYLVRDRDVKLRLYPGIAPMLIFPFIFLFNATHTHYGSATGASAFEGFPVAFAGAYLGLIPFLALYHIRYSQQWQASDIFRVAPMMGPAPLCLGASRAVLVCLTLPALIFFGVIIGVFFHQNTEVAMFIPGILTFPVYALFPCLGGKGVPLSLPTEEAKAAGRGLTMYAFLIIAAAVAGLAIFARYLGVFWWFVIGEAIAVVVTCVILQRMIETARWDSPE